MNDISVKTVDFGKEQSGAETAAPADPVPENEVDPLAIDDSKIKGVEAVETVEVPEFEKPEVEKTVESDQNAKDENLSEDLGSKELKLQTQHVEEDLLKEDTLSYASATEEPTEPESSQNGTEVELTQPETETIAEPAQNEASLDEAVDVPEVTEAPAILTVPETPVLPALVDPVVSVPSVPFVPAVVTSVVPDIPKTPVISAEIAPTVSVDTVTAAPRFSETPVTVAPSCPVAQTVSATLPVSTTPVLATSSVPVAPIDQVTPPVSFLSKLIGFPVAAELPVPPTIPVAPISATPIVSAAPIVPVAPIVSAAPIAPAVSTFSTVPIASSLPIAPSAPIVPSAPIAPAAPIILAAPIVAPDLAAPTQIKEPTPPKEVPIKEPVKEEEVKLLERIVEKVVDADVEMIEPPIKVKIEEKMAAKPQQAVNGDVAKEEQATKRRSSEETETESPLKKLCQEVEKTFPQHDTMINDYIQTATKNNIDEIQRHTEQLLSEIQTLRELAQKKEHEWNNILHLKKVKEEILLRLLRRKQVLSFEKAADVNGSNQTDPFDYLNQAKNLAIDKSDEISGLSLKPPCSTMNPIIQAPVMPVTTHFNPMVGLPPPYDKAAHMQSMPKPVFPQPLLLPGPTMPGFPRDMNGQLPTGFGMPMGRQGPTKDVKSIIADYRQRNPDITPRRGRRMKSILNPNMMNNPRAIAPKMMENMNNFNNLNNLNMLFNNLDMNQKAMLERLQQIQAGALPNGVSFKDVLVQFANMQQAPGMPGMPTRHPETVTTRPEHHAPRPERRRERHEEPIQNKQAERMASPSPRLPLPPPPPYPEISLLPVPVPSGQDTPTTQQNSLLHGILTKQATPAQSYSPTLAKLLTSPERKQSPNLPAFGQAKNCGEITITPVQPTPPPADAPSEKPEEVVQLDDEESPASEGSAAASPADGGRLVIDEGSDDAPPCQGCRRRAAQFVCAGCANQWYCSRDCQVAAWDDHSEMCSG